MDYWTTATTTIPPDMDYWTTATTTIIPDDMDYWTTAATTAAPDMTGPPATTAATTAPPATTAATTAPPATTPAMTAKTTFPTPQGYKITGSGPGAVRHGAHLGLYELTGDTVRGYPMWKHKCQNMFLFFNGEWRVGPTTGTYRGTHFKNEESPPPKIPPMTGWQYWDGETWPHDDTIKFDYVDSDQIAQWRCPTSRDGGVM